MSTPSTTVKLNIQEIDGLYNVLRFSGKKDAMGAPEAITYPNKLFSGVRWFFKNTKGVFDAYQDLFKKKKEVFDEQVKDIKGPDKVVKLNELFNADQELIDAHRVTEHDVEIGGTTLGAMQYAFDEREFQATPEDIKLAELAERIGVILS